MVLIVSCSYEDILTTAKLNYFLHMHHTGGLQLQMIQASRLSQNFCNQFQDLLFCTMCSFLSFLLLLSKVHVFILELRKVFFSNTKCDSFGEDM